METARPNTKHIGRKINRIRELRGIKQETFAVELGISQQTVSRLEQSEEIEEDMLEKIANVLGVTSEGIKNFSEEAVFNIIGNNYHDNSSSVQYQCTFNPIDKLVEVFEENKKLYEQLLASEREKVELLKKSK
ncbi:DNA-binding transcriptional regulator, XRE-family HTH domain [Mucilaginibacter pineti]|uniref:DNA-binding transcriptional regulator, XRE-family HTH domain n=1 Tax=Mucilaginibacter pineti TaxID=1391627 RepID=A0A1G7L2S2_9SPHI|nr:helix-turn-helix transcriptional regulator [Mucilaginibacter pineti]SDF43390.1 DNA-binding transcriptional regulator, XRE-family HTH domain [Mucilaginibacter pineti]